MLAFLEKYRISEKNKISIFGILKMIFPTVFIIGFIWLLIIVLWYVMGLPLGIHILPTL